MAESSGAGFLDLPAAPVLTPDRSAGSVVDQFVERASARALKSVDVLGKLAIGLIVVVAVVDVLYAWTTWNVYGVIDEMDGEGGFESLNAADRLAATVGIVFIVVWVAAGIAFTAWLWRARSNAETLRPVQHTRSRGWVIGGWIVPIVSFWFPYQVVRDVYAASNPAVPTPGSDVIKRAPLPSGPLLVAWWGSFLISLGAEAVSLRIYRGDPGSTIDSILEWLYGMAVADSVAAAAAVLAAFFAIKIIRDVNAWQTPLVKISPGQPGDQVAQAAPPVTG